MARSPPASAGAIPSGIYAQYKRATSYFLHWLLRAHNGGVGAFEDAAPLPKEPLELYNRVVAAIAREPTALSPSQLQLYPHALEACESAITLRARVTLTFGDAADGAHAHFLSRLKTWFRLLKSAYGVLSPASTDATTSPASSDGDANNTTVPLDFSNYYAVLALPDDYFAAEAEPEREPNASPLVARLSPQEEKVLFDEAFAQDLHTELACLFMELDELSEAVYSAFHDVKCETKTLIEATAVAKIAIEAAQSVLATLQLRYPAIRDGDDLVTLIRDRMTILDLDQLLVRVMTAWTPLDEEEDDEVEQEPEYRYVPGTILADVLSVAPILVNFGRRIRSRPGRPLAAPPDEKYDEEETSRRKLMGLTLMAEQLPALHNFLMEIRQLDALSSDDFGAIWFLPLFEDLSAKGTVSMELVFTCICWVRSVAALEGNKGLSRTVSLSIMHRWDLEDRLSQSIASARAHNIDPPTLENWQELLAMIHQSTDYAALLRLNPLLAGCFLTFHQIRYLSLGHDVMLMNSRFRAFSHLYLALRDRRLLDEIPFVEDAIRVYDSVLFTPSRAAASTHGSYARSYLAAQSLMQASRNAILNGRAFSAPEAPTSAYERVRLPHLARSLKVMYLKDLAAPPPGFNAASSWKSLLSAASDLFHEELFHSRLLSRDMTKLNDDLTDLFFSLCDELCRRPQLESMVENTDRNVHPIQAMNSALEYVVVFPLVPLLDALQDDESINLAAAPAGLESFRRERMSPAASGRLSDVALAYCRHAASVISRRFGRLTPSQMEKIYFTLPPTPAWAATEFGSAHFRHKTPNFDDPEAFLASHRATGKILDSLMEMLRTSQGPLRGKKLERLKRNVIAHPSLLAMASMDHELCTLLHHAAAGPARDRRVVEWLIQMGALDVEPPHCRAPEILQSADDSSCCNALAVHCAANEKLTEIVKLILAAGNFRDLDTMTYRTKESLVHIAVSTGNRELFSWLMAMSADVTGRTSSGKRVWHLTSDPSWKAEILEIVDFQKTQANRRQSKLAKGVPTASGTRSEQLWRSLQSQRDAERMAATGGRTAPALTTQTETLTESAVETSGGNGKKKKKKNKKKNKKKQAAHSNGTSDVTSASNLMEQLLVSNRTSEVTDVKIQRLSEALDKVKVGASSSREEREASAGLAVEILAEFEHIAESCSTVHHLISSSKLHVHMEDAARAVELLDAYYHQLPNTRISSIKEADIEYHRQLVGQGNSSAQDAYDRPLSNVERLFIVSGPSDDEAFYTFFQLVSRVAIALSACELKARAESIAALLERRLLAMPRRTAIFRQLVEQLVAWRQMTNAEPLLGTTADAQRQFEWYSCTHGMNSESLTQLDRFYGCSRFLQLKIVGGFDAPAYESCVEHIQAMSLPCRTLVFIDGCIVAGADSFQDMKETVDLVVHATLTTGLGIDFGQSRFDASSVVLMGFEFSATQIIRHETVKWYL